MPPHADSPKVFRLYRRRDKADLYERVFSRPWKRVQTFLLGREIERLARLPDRAWVLDMPCGTGRMMPFLAPPHGTYVGADISIEMIRRARMRSPPGAARARFVLCDARRPPFRPGAFHRVACIRFLCHLSADLRVRVLRRLRGLTRLDIVAEFMHRYHFKYLSRWLRQRFGRAVRTDRMLSGGQIREEVRAAACVLMDRRSPAPLFGTTWLTLLRPALTPAVQDFEVPEGVGLDVPAARAHGEFVCPAGPRRDPVNA